MDQLRQAGTNAQPQIKNACSMLAAGNGAHAVSTAPSSESGGLANTVAVARWRDGRASHREATTGQKV
jgi:endonuclease YncB( thermonuclease family)